MSAAEVILIQRSKEATGLGALESIIERFDVKTRRITPISTPPVGYCDQYPVGDGIGNIIYYRGPIGRNVNTNALDFDIVVNGFVRSRPQWRESLFGALACSWGPAGHAAISPTEQKLIHSARVDKNLLGRFDKDTGRLYGGLPFSQEWQIIETDFKLTASSQRTIKGKDNTEPNWSSAGITWIDKSQPQHYVCVNNIRIASPGLAFDPILSPDGSKVAWLVLEGRIGSSALENLFNVNWSIYVSDIETKSIKQVVKAEPFVLNSHPHWYDDETIMWSRVYDDKSPWLLWTVNINNPKTADKFTFDTDGSISMAWPIHV